MSDDLIILLLALVGLSTVTFGIYYVIGRFFDWVEARLRRRFGIDEDTPR